MKYILAIDSFKGCLSSGEVETALAETLCREGIETVCLPMSDGGDGMLHAFTAALGGTLEPVYIHDQMMRRVDAQYAIAPDGGLTVRLWGLSEEIEAVTAENLRVIADMSAVTGQGTVTVPVTVTISGFNDVTVRGTYELTVTVTDVAPTVPETAEGAAASHPAA